MFEQPQLLIYYDQKKEETFTRKNSAPDSQSFLALPDEILNIDPEHQGDMLKKSPSLNIRRGYFIPIESSMKQSVYSPDEKIQYHTKTFSLSEEIGLACDPNPSLPLQFHHTSKEGLTSTSHSHISSAKRPFISSLKLFEQDPSRKEGFLGSRENSRKQTSSIEGSLLDATRLKMTSPLANSKLSNEKSHNLERSELSSSQLEQVKKFPYNSHLNIVNSNVYVQYQLGTPKNPVKNPRKAFGEPTVKTGPSSPQEISFQKTLSNSGFQYQSSVSLKTKPSAKLIVLSKDTGPAAPTKRTVQAKNSDAATKCELKKPAPNASSKAIHRSVVDQRLGTYHASKGEISQEKVAGSLAHLKSVLLKSINNSKHFDIYKSDGNYINPSKGKSESQFFTSQMKRENSVESNLACKSKDTIPTKRTPSAKNLLIPDLKFFQSRKSLERISLCAYHGSKQPEHLKTLYGEIELLISGCNPVSDASIPRKFYLPPKKKPDQGTLIIGLSEILVREVDYDQAVHLSKSSQINTVQVTVGKSSNSVTPLKRIYQLRPGLQEALSLLAEQFELVIWSEMPSEISNQLVDAMDPQNKYITFRLYLEECFEVNLLTKGTRIVKPHNIFANRSYHDVFQLCHQANYAYPYLDRMIPLVPFTKNTDSELKSLTTWIKMISDREGGFLFNLLNFIEREFGFTSQCSRFLGKLTSKQTASN